MDSVVEFEIDGQNRRSVQIVYPGDANIDQKKISVLTSIGAALIGLSAGQTIPMNGHDGRPHKLTVVSVSSHT
jgi:regulator of nucleoside diphosphate kinase